MPSITAVYLYEVIAIFLLGGFIFGIISFFTGMLWATKKFQKESIELYKMAAKKKCSCESKEKYNEKTT